ncbi:fungal-specific transcription factor domain-containing protein [Xylaria intraflava]|nr:fungal-specific transcription factor domain-containing protein [Xylaria intraflava]
MPRPKRPGVPEPKRRSRNGCWPCKNRKVKCGEEHPVCVNCQRTGETCDYSIRLNWEGRKGKQVDSSVVALTRDTLSPTVPARGFKLVHQYPSLDSPGARRLEPLKAEPYGYTGPDRHISPSQIGVNFVATPRSFSGESEQHPSKRIKLGDAQPAEYYGARPYSSHSSTLESASATLRLSVSSGASAASPLTPATSSTYSDDGQPQISRSEPEASSYPTKRLSVNSLLAGPANLRALYNDSTSHAKGMLPPLNTTPTSNEPTFYGIDRGIQDYDLGKNDDMNAISGSSPLLRRASLDTPPKEPSDYSQIEFGFGIDIDTNDSETDRGYYSKPVSIYIPRNLEPLPTRLTENPMNLLVSDLRSWARRFTYEVLIVLPLVPYDDPHTNPFRTILPQMAVNNDNLLALLLAYSASHRARVLNHPEPTLRIAFWVDDIFPALREALNDPDRNFSDANLATAIMLASLEIISPRIFGYDIPWQRHLALAREVIMIRPGGLRGFQSNFRQDQVCSFLFSWAAYLDVIGSLTGGPKDASSSWIFDYELDDIDDGYDEIDCIMGFTTRCCYLLAKIADLARKCDAERIGDNSYIRENWVPSIEVAGWAEGLERAVKDSMAQAPVPCKHIHTGNVEKWDRKEMEATNMAYHWAALAHLYRRILGRRSTDKVVQGAAEEIISCLGRIRPGSTAEACLLFPMFTAGCDTQNEGHRELILDRFISAEKHGMTQVHNARRIMQRVWETKRPWETLVSTEFIG